MTRFRLRKQIADTQEQIERAQEELERQRSSATAPAAALAAAERRQPAVESMVGFLVGTREQNGFGEKFRITSLTRSDVTERHA